MSSTALTKWQTKRTAGLDRVISAHISVSGSGAGARKVTEELNHALVVRLATEFQGFVRELHDEAAEALVRALAPDDRARQERLIIPYQHSRRIDRGNAGPETLRIDFGLYGLRLWTRLRDRYPRQALEWERRLALLNEARNGLVHADDRRIQAVRTAGWPITLGASRQWRTTLDALAVAIDHVVADHFERELGVRPW